MTMPGALPTVDVSEADRRLREDPDRPLLLDVREPNEFIDGPGAGRRPPADVAVHGPDRRAADRSAAPGHLPHRRSVGGRDRAT